MAAAVLAAAAASSQAATVNFLFDNTPDGTLTPPYVGSGVLTFNGPATAGTVALSSLNGLAMTFTFGAATYTLANLTTPIANIQAQFTTVGSDLVLRFGGTRGGPQGGSADFNNGSGVLSFQPNFGSLYFQESQLGTYSAIVQQEVPEPMSLALVALGLVAAGAVRRRTR